MRRLRSTETKGKGVQDNLGVEKDGKSRAQTFHGQAVVSYRYTVRSACLQDYRMGYNKCIANPSFLRKKKPSIPPSPPDGS